MVCLSYADLILKVLEHLLQDDLLLDAIIVFADSKLIWYLEVVSVEMSDVGSGIINILCNCNSLLSFVEQLARIDAINSLSIIK